MGLISKFLAPWRTADKFDAFLEAQRALQRDQYALARAQTETCASLVQGLRELNQVWMRGLDAACEARTNDEDRQAWEAFDLSVQEQNKKLLD